MSNVTSEILFDKFEVIECFKKDEHASVYLANHIYLGKKIILKALNTKTIFDEAKVERFKREAKIMAKLEHPNIIKVLDFGTHNEYFYISFEYFESKNLRSFIKDKSLSLEQKRDLVIQLFHGLGYAHQNQIIHRDIKPENILVNNNFELKIGDFGLALALNDNFVTSQYAIVGTPCYMSPEQVQGNKLTAKSDLFSAGILALELFTQKNPFLGDDVNQTISNVINFDSDTVEAYLTELPGELQEVIGKLLSKKPDRRYSSAEAVLKDLSVPLSEIKVSPLAYLKRKSVLYPAAGFVIVLLALFIWQNFDGFEQNNTDDLTPSKIESPNNLTTEENLPVEDQQATTQVPDENDDTFNEPEGNIADNATSNETPTETLDDNSPPVEENTNETAAVQFGSLFVECLPWAHVYLDDRRLETTPLSESINLQAGVYNIRLVHPSFPEFSKQIEIKPDEVTNISVNLDTLYGYLSCNVFPWGDVYLNEEFIGQTPFAEPIKLSPGSHILKIKNPNYNEVVKQIDIKKQDTLFVQYNLNDAGTEKFGSKN